jgi:hypothetical protein
VGAGIIGTLMLGILLFGAIRAARRAT